MVTSRELASIAFTVMGVFALIAAAPLLQVVLAGAFYTDELPPRPVAYFLAVSLPAALLVTGGVWLILKRRTLADGMSSEESDPPEPLSPHWVESLVFAMVGLYLAVSTLPDLAGSIANIIWIRAIDIDREYLPTIRNNVAFTIGTIGKFVAGAYLFLYADRIPTLRRSLTRRRETAPQPDDDRPACANCGTRYAPEDYRPEVAERRCSRCGALLEDDGSA